MSDNNERIHGSGILFAAVIGVGWWALAIWAFAKQGTAGLAVVLAVSFLSIAAALVKLRD